MIKVSFLKYHTLLPLAQFLLCPLLAYPHVHLHTLPELLQALPVHHSMVLHSVNFNNVQLFTPLKAFGQFISNWSNLLAMFTPRSRALDFTFQNDETNLKQRLGCSRLLFRNLRIISINLELYTNIFLHHS